MQLKYEIAPIEEVPKNKWFLPIAWMSGDADHYDYKIQEYNSESEFLTAYNFLKDEANKLDLESYEVRDLFYDKGIDPVTDIIYNQCAMPELRYNAKPYYYDENGIKYNIIIE